MGLDDRTAEERIVATLQAAGGPLAYGAVVKSAGVHDAQAARVLSRMALRNAVLKTNGRYVLPRFAGAPMVSVEPASVLDPPACRTCGKMLLVPETWWPSYKKSGNKLCIDCASKKHRDAASVPARGSHRQRETKGKVATPLALTHQPPASAPTSGTNVAIDPTVPFVELAHSIRTWLERVKIERVRAILVEHHLRELQGLIEEGNL